jgi:hypothetical protein
LDISTYEPEGTADCRSRDDICERIVMSGAVRGTAGYKKEYRVVINRSDKQFCCYRQVKFIRHFE